MIVADTDVLIDYLRGWEPVQSQILELLGRGGLAVTAITRFELRAGAHTERQQRSTSDLLATLQVLPLTAAAADRAASVQLKLQQRGETIGFADSLICGIVLEAGATLLTRNRRILMLLDQVAAGEEIEITKHGRRVAKLVPAEGPAVVAGAFAGVAVSAPEDDLLSTEVEWDLP